MLVAARRIALCAAFSFPLGACAWIANPDVVQDRDEAEAELEAAMVQYGPETPEVAEARARLERAQDRLDESAAAMLGELVGELAIYAGALLGLGGLGFAGKRIVRNARARRRAAEGDAS